jgi:prephenate dehydrogenase
VSGTLGLIGYGRFGRAFGELASQADLQVRAFDPEADVPQEHRAASAAEVVATAETIVLAVPVAEIRNALQALRRHLVPSRLVLDVGSVKTRPIAAMREVLGSDVPWVGTHPLFGPTSIARGERPLHVVICPNAMHPAAATGARALYERLGCQVREQDPDSHDRLMADTHALAFFVAKGMTDAGIGPDATGAPPSFQAIARTIEAVRSDAAHLFTAIQTENPYAAEARRRLLMCLAAADRALLSLESGEAADSIDGRMLQIADLGAQSPDLREARDLIDDVDREILGLLARRAQLVRRAAKAKADIGRGIRDPRREEALLAARRAWAGELDLDAGSVEEIFWAILRLSWNLQHGPRKD